VTCGMSWADGRQRATETGAGIGIGTGAGILTGSIGFQQTRGVHVAPRAPVFYPVPVYPTYTYVCPQPVYPTVVYEPVVVYQPVPVYPDVASEVLPGAGKLFLDQVLVVKSSSAVEWIKKGRPVAAPCSCTMVLQQWVARIEGVRAGEAVLCCTRSRGRITWEQGVFGGFEESPE